MTTEYSSWAIWIILIAGGIGTYIIRLSFILLLGRLEKIPNGIIRILRFVPSAVLTALVVPAVVYVDGSFVLSPENNKVVASMVAAVVAWRTQSVLATIGIGMVVLWGLQMI
jgi:branched-subunit amino acid transport protein